MIVECIINHQHHGKSRVLQYLIEWKGYPESNNTWEPATQIHTPDLLKAYHRKHPLEHIKAALFNTFFPITSPWISPTKKSSTSTTLPFLILDFPASASLGTAQTLAYHLHPVSRPPTVGTSLRRTKNSWIASTSPCRPQ